MAARVDYVNLAVFGQPLFAPFDNYDECYALYSTGEPWSRPLISQQNSQIGYPGVGTVSVDLSK